jgi:hypothetical protein
MGAIAVTSAVVTKWFFNMLNPRYVETDVDAYVQEAARLNQIDHLMLRSAYTSFVSVGHTDSEQRSVAEAMRTKLAQDHPDMNPEERCRQANHISVLVCQDSQLRSQQQLARGRLGIATKLWRHYGHTQGEIVYSFSALYQAALDLFGVRTVSRVPRPQ